MLPGKKYTPEDFVRIAWNRKWLILIPTIVIAVATFVWSTSLPDVYRSEARILIVPQQVPSNFVQPTVTSGLDDRLQAISQEILSRTRLEVIIQEFNLYADERKVMLMEDIIERMRRDVAINIARAQTRQGDPGSFVVRYDSNDPRTAMQVAERLAALFIDENLEDRATLSEQTNEFLQAQMEDARGRLIEHEQKLEAFRMAHMGELPTQVASNLQVMQGTQQQLQSLIDASGRDHDRQVTLDRLIAEAEAVQVATPSRPAAENGALESPAGGSAAEQLNVARATLQSLEVRLTPEHPDVLRAKRIIRDLEAQAEVEAKAAFEAKAELLAKAETDAAEQPPVAEGPELVTPAEAARRQRLLEMRAERDSLERRIAANAADQARLQEVLASYRRRVEAAPSRESELTELMRDYGTLQESYNSLLTKSQASNIATNLERRQIGQHFKMIDAARFPERPISPDRVRINAMGALAGLGFALALVALLEYRDTTVKTAGDVLVSLALPVIAVIPTMMTAGERRRRTRRRALAIAASSAVVVSAVAVVAWRFRLLDNLPVLERWVR